MLAVQERTKQWMSSLPPSEMDMDCWKRLYSNAPSNKFREIAIGGLWAGAAIPNSQNEEVSCCCSAML